MDNSTLDGVDAIYIGHPIKCYVYCLMCRCVLDLPSTLNIHCPINHISPGVSYGSLAS